MRAIRGLQSPYASAKNEAPASLIPTFLPGSEFKVWAGADEFSVSGTVMGTAGPQFAEVQEILPRST
jgi:hypothetical protein